MTISEALKTVEEILAGIAVTGRENVRRMNQAFDLIDATIAALQQAKDDAEEKE